MRIYNIADLYVSLECAERTMKRAEKYYLTDSDINPDISIKTTPEEIADIYRLDWTEEVKAYVYEGKLFYSELARRFNGMMIHSSAVVLDGNAYLFSAPSGTGKSTHTRLWLQKFENRAYILNDDKPAVRIMPDGIFVYGTPWRGKDDVSINKKAPLKGICFLNRDKTNWIKTMDTESKVVNLYHSAIKKVDKEVALKQLDIIENIIKKIPIYEMGCNISEESVEVSYNKMFYG